MIKLAMTTAAVALAMTTGALAEKWSVTEQAASGIKYATGTWTLNAEGDKVAGKADMQLDNGTMLSYKLEGTVAGGVYTLNFVGRDDGKKNCVFTGKPSAGNARVYAGEAACEGQTLSIRGGVQ
jgi:hypothetical protein